MGAILQSRVREHSAGRSSCEPQRKVSLRQASLQNFTLASSLGLWSNRCSFADCHRQGPLACTVITKHRTHTITKLPFLQPQHLFAIQQTLCTLVLASGDFKAKAYLALTAQLRRRSLAGDGLQLIGDCLRIFLPAKLPVGRPPDAVITNITHFVFERCPEPLNRRKPRRRCVRRAVLNMAPHTRRRRWPATGRR